MMIDKPKGPLPSQYEGAISRAVDATKDKAALNDQTTHPQRLRLAMFTGAAFAAKEYKRSHPQASKLITKIETLAFQPKPSGYSKYIDNLVSYWLSGKVDCQETNVATVGRIRDRFPNNRFSANLMNKPLSSAALDKIKRTGIEHGVAIDTRLHTTLSKLKAAARAKAFQPLANRELSIRAVISDDVLSANGREYKITTHGDGKRIQFRHKGKRINLRIDHLEAFADEVWGSHPLISYEVGIGMCLQTHAETAETRDRVPEADDFCASLHTTTQTLQVMCLQNAKYPEKNPENLGIVDQNITGNLPPADVPPPLTLSERIAAQRARHNTATSLSALPVDGPDPLTLLI